MSKTPQGQHDFVASMAAPSVLSTGAFYSSVRTHQTANGNHVIEGIRIFKAGTFSDSMGMVRTWEESHLEQMVFHYRMLRDQNVFPNVPVRVDHSGSARDVVGYFANLYRDAEDPMFLAADIEITEPDAYEKWERGTYRSRSLEVGMYETNDEAAYWPVVMGLAFVDIPAVEGLHAKGPNTLPKMPEGIEGRASHSFSQTLRDKLKETDSVTEEEFLAACAYASWVEAAEYAQRCDDWTAAVSYAAAVDAHNQEAQSLGLTANHGRGAPAMFRVAGAQVADHAAVQGHIDALESFQRETIETGRRDFVNGLAESGRIAATQIDSMNALVATMSHEQFGVYQKSYEGAPATSLMGQYGHQNGTGATPTPPSADGTPSEIDTLEEIVANHRRAGKSQEQIEALGSYQKLQSLKSTQGK